MKIVIKLDDNIYGLLKRTERLFKYIDEEDDTVETALMKAVADGTPLPEHHGRLIDADKLELDDGYSNYDGYYHTYSRSQIYNAPTVLEAEGKADANSVGLVCDIFDKMNRDEQIKVWQYVNEIMEGE